MDRRESLWGLSLAGLQLWNALRSLDFLQSRPDVDGERIGAAGATGRGASPASNCVLSHPAVEGGARRLTPARRSPTFDRFSTLIDPENARRHPPPTHAIRAGVRRFASRKRVI